MGNDQSRHSANGNGEGVVKSLDYYELLQVDEEATFDEIKVNTMPRSASLHGHPADGISQRSYRRLALLQHPDKNPHRIEEATKLFADLQQAYEVGPPARELWLHMTDPKSGVERSKREFRPRCTS